MLIFLPVSLSIFNFAPSPALAAHHKKPMKVKAKKAKVKTKKLSRQPKQKKVVRKARKKPARRANFLLPARTGVISQNYTLGTAVNEGDAQRVVGALRALGVQEAEVGAGGRTVRVKFNSQELSSLGIIQKLKELGYTIKRID